MPRSLMVRTSASDRSLDTDVLTAARLKLRRAPAVDRQRKRGCMAWRLKASMSDSHRTLAWSGADGTPKNPRSLRKPGAMPRQARATKFGTDRRILDPPSPTNSAEEATKRPRSAHRMALIRKNSRVSSSVPETSIS